MNKFFDKHLYETQVNSENKELLEEYKIEMIAQGKSKGTIKQYYNDIRIVMFLVYKNFKNKTFCDLTRKDCKKLMISMQTDLDMSSARCNRIKSSLSTMMDFAIDDPDYEEEYKVNHFVKIKGLKKKPIREIHFLTQKQIDLLYNYLIEHEKYQEALFLALAIDSAGRKNELYQVRKDSIFDDGSFTNTVTGKGGKEFKLMYHDRTKEAFKLYMKNRGEDNLLTLWITRKNGKKTPLAYTSLDNMKVRWINILEKITGKRVEFNIHSLRHTSLELYNTGEHYMCKKLGIDKMELTVLQKLAHHNDISTTESYLKDRSEDELMSSFQLI